MNEACWLAEQEHQTHKYLVSGSPGHPAILTSDPHKATRFKTREEAQAACANSYVVAFLGSLRPVEHLFLKT